jgi:hypothetical protein
MSEGEVQRSMGRIEGKLDAVLDQLKAHTDLHGRLEGRVRKVEGRQHWYSGAGAAIGLVLGFFTKAHT